MDCVDCGDSKIARFSDPRSPPLDEGECLCDDCYKTAVLDCLDDALKAVDDALRLSIAVVPGSLRTLRLQRLRAIADEF